MKTLEQINQDFLIDIQANPNDNSIRAVYADWLESIGQSKKANYLRLEELKKLVIETEEASKEFDEVWKIAVARVVEVKCSICGGDASFAYNDIQNSAYCPGYQCGRSFTFKFMTFAKYKFRHNVYLRLDGSNNKWWKRV